MLDYKNFEGLTKKIEHLNIELNKAQEELWTYKNTNRLKFNNAEKQYNYFKKFNTFEDQYNDCKSFITFYEEYLHYRKSVEFLYNKVQLSNKQLLLAVEAAYSSIKYATKTINENDIDYT